MARDVVVGLAPYPTVYGEDGSRNAILAEVVYAEAQSAAAYSLTAEAAAFTLAGQSVSFGQIASRQIVLVGQPTPVIITASANRELPAGAVVFNETTPVVSYGLNAERGIFTLDGQAATFVFSGAFVPEARAFTLGGQDVTLRKAWRLTASGADFTYLLASTQDTLQAFEGTFALTGSDATLTYAPTSAKLSAGGGVFVLSSPDVIFARTLPMAAAAGEFALSGQSASFLRPYRLTAEVGALTLTGIAATLTAPNIIAYPLSSRVITI